MIHLIIATFPEANYFIKYLQLKKISSISEFDIYYNNKFTLTISGMGKVNSAIAVAQTYQEFGKNRNNNWLNIGIAGHNNSKLGDIYIINKISEDNSNRCFFPYSPCLTDVQNNSCITYQSVNNEYNDSLSDMELSGFFEAANKYSYKELIHSIKIVSDNKYESIDFKDKKVVERLFSDKSSIFNKFFNTIESLSNEAINNTIMIDRKINELIGKVKFTSSENEQAKKLLKLIFLKKKKIDYDIFNSSSNKKQIINQLRILLKL